MVRNATTSFEGEYFLHSFLWGATQHQLEQAATLAKGYQFDDLAAMVLAFNTLEAYLNFVGDRLAPEIWKDERRYFRSDGFGGKIRKVFELCHLSELNKEQRPYASVWQAKEIRDLIAHAKTERESGQVRHAADDEPPKWIPSIESLVTHERATQFVDDIGSN
jgi:hypothetical protein